MLACARGDEVADEGAFAFFVANLLRTCDAEFKSNPISYKLRTHVYISAVIGGICAIVMIAFMIPVALNGIMTEPQQIRGSDSVGEITAPIGWNRTTTLHEDANIQISNENAELYLLVLSEPKSDFPSSYSLEDYSKLTRDVFILSLTSKKVSPPQRININGMDSLQVEIRGKSPLAESVYTGGKLIMGTDIEIVWLHVSISGKNHFHQILAWSLANSDLKNQPILESIIMTFKE